MYELPPPYKPPAKPTAAGLATVASFVEYLTEGCRQGGGLLDPRLCLNRLDLESVGFPAFWAAVEAELVGTPWKLEPSGLRDGGASRRLLPR